MDDCIEIGFGILVLVAVFVIITNYIYMDKPDTEVVGSENVIMTVTADNTNVVIVVNAKGENDET